jgi:hypothetical protein
MTTPTDLPHPRFARMYLRAAKAAEQRGATEHRRRLLDGLSGTVLELGAGHGLNFPHYPAEVTEVIAIEPEPILRAQAIQAAASAPVPVRVLGGVADQLPLDQESVDAAVASLVLCSVPDQERAALLRARDPQPPAQAPATPSRRPQRPVALDRRRLPPSPRHHCRHPTLPLRDPNQRTDHVRRLPIRALDPSHPRQRPQDLISMVSPAGTGKRSLRHNGILARRFVSAPSGV